MDNASQHMICGNCLNRGAKLVPVGPEKGSHPYRAQVSLCKECAGYLLDGQFNMLAICQADERTITTPTKGVSDD